MENNILKSTDYYYLLELSDGVEKSSERPEDIAASDIQTRIEQFEDQLDDPSMEYQERIYSRAQFKEKVRAPLLVTTRHLLTNGSSTRHGRYCSTKRSERSMMVSTAIFNSSGNGTKTTSEKALPIFHATLIVFSRRSLGSGSSTLPILTHPWTTKLHQRRHQHDMVPNLRRPGRGDAAFAARRSRRRISPIATAPSVRRASVLLVGSRGRQLVEKLDVPSPAALAEQLGESRVGSLVRKGTSSGKRLGIAERR